jgi:hypothetical protein
MTPLLGVYKKRGTDRQVHSSFDIAIPYFYTDMGPNTGNGIPRASFTFVVGLNPEPYMSRQSRGTAPSKRMTIPCLSGVIAALIGSLNPLASAENPKILSSFIK